MIITKNELRTVRTDAHDTTIALRFGCYDLLHSAHQRSLEHAAQYADILVVGLMSDDYIRSTKGPDRPINTEDDRLVAIDEADTVNYTFVAPAGTLSLAGIFLALRPDVYIEDEERGASSRLLKRAFLGAIGTDYIIAPRGEGSTSDMIATLGLEAARASAGLDFNYQTSTGPNTI